MTAERRKLTGSQQLWLVLVEAAGKQGHSATAVQPSLRALERRGLVTAQHCRSSFDNRRWVATFTGREWVRSRPR